MSQTEPFIIDSLDKLAAFEVHSKGTLKSAYVWYRGLKRAKDHRLVPHAIRELKPTDILCNSEAALASAFIARARSRYPRERLPADAMMLDWLALMRHYELPTRLLDWTETLITAAYFATEKDADDDAVIWALDPYGLWRLRSTSLHRIPSSEDVRTPITSDAGVYNLIREMAFDALKGRISYGEDLRANRDTIPIPIVPSEADPRMLVQRAVFTLHNSRLPLEDSKSVTSVLFRATIPRAFRETLRSRLRSLGICRANLFPDVESLASDLRERYVVTGGK